MTRLWLKLKLAVLLLLAGCTVHTKPWCWEQPIGDLRLAWFADGPGKVETCVNPTDRRATVALSCPGERQTYHWSLEVPAHGETRALIESMNYQQMVQWCSVEN